jgi:hypothetical protein
MKAAFLFEETCPKDDRTLQLTSSIRPGVRGSLNVIVSTDLWHLHDASIGQHIAKDNIVGASLFLNGEESLAKGAQERTTTKLAPRVIFVVEITSIGRKLVLQLHGLVSKVNDYLGFVEVLPYPRVRLRAFNGYEPELRVGNSNVFVLYREHEYESIAGEEFERTGSHCGQFGLFTEKCEIDVMNTVLESSSLDPIYLREGFATIREQRDGCCENLIHKLTDAAPDACHGLLESLQLLSKGALSPAAGRQLAVNLKACIEKAVDALSPPRSQDENAQNELPSHVSEGLPHANQGLRIEPRRGTNAKDTHCAVFAWESMFEPPLT